MQGSKKLNCIEYTNEFVTKTLNIYHEEVKQGSVKAMNILGYICQNGLEPHKPNYHMAVSMFEKAISLGYGEAYNNLAIMYQDGTHPDGKNFDKAEELFKKAIDLKIGVAACNLGRMYSNLERYKDSLEMYTKSIEMECMYALIFLAHLYYNGFHPDGKNIDKAEELYKKAIELELYTKFPIVFTSLADVYYIKKQYAKAEELYTKAVDLGCDRAMNNLANMYSNSEHSEGYDEIKAIELYSMAVKLNNVNAINNLAYTYWKTDNFINHKQAEKLYKRGVELGSSKSMCNLAKLYYYDYRPNEIRVEDNIIYELLDSSIKLDYVEAILFVANLYESGDHKDYQNCPKAAELYVKAFQLGHTQSLISISRLYRNGYYNDHDKYKEFYERVTDNNILNMCVKPSKVLKRIYDDVNKDNCAICHNTLLNTNNELRTTTCGHIFHLECSLKIEGCPVCRSTIKKIFQ